MVRQIFIPVQVKDAIKKHLNDAISRGIKGYESAYEDEDVLTGHLFGLMKCDEQLVVVENVEIGGTWKWSIDYKKFGGRGKGATESIIGADGIFELALYRNNEVINKSLLFQSKLDWVGRDKNLYIQSVKLLTWLGAVTIINYTQQQFETYAVDNIIASQGRKPAEMKPLNELLCENFIDCLIGDSDLKYDAFAKKLIWLDINNDLVATRFNLNRRLKISVKAPKKFPYEDRKVNKLIPNEDISKHRLKTSIADYDIGSAKSLAEVRKLQNKISLAFHPDRHQTLPPAQMDLLSELMKFYNNQIDEQREYIKRRNKYK